MKFSNNRIQTVQYKGSILLQQTEYNIYLGVQQTPKMSRLTNIPITIINNAIVIMLHHVRSMLFVLQNEITNLSKMFLAVGLIWMLLKVC